MHEGVEGGDVLGAHDAEDRCLELVEQKLPLRTPSVREPGMMSTVPVVVMSVKPAAARALGIWRPKRPSNPPAVMTDQMASVTRR